MSLPTDADAGGTEARLLANPKHAFLLWDAELRAVLAMRTMESIFGRDTRVLAKRELTSRELTHGDRRLGTGR